MIWLKSTSRLRSATMETVSGDDKSASSQAFSRVSDRVKVNDTTMTSCDVITALHHYRILDFMHARRVFVTTLCFSK